MSAMQRLAGAGVLALAAFAVVGSGLRLAGVQEQPFPHEAHQGLFPLCTGCHEGVPVGNASDYYPEPASCAGCHDGVREERVSWPGPTDEVDNVTYDHAEHAQELTAAGDAPLECASCHIPPGGERMAVADSVQLTSCWGCHEGTDHQVDADCAVCHVPLAETGFDRSRIAVLPVPVDHEAGEFLDEVHGLRVREETARCATCHTQERCVACHVDSGIAEIATFPAAPPGMDLPEATAHYNEPATHLADEWAYTHAAAASRRDCATCHTSNDCASCHVAPLPRVAATLPARAAVTAPGVMLVAAAPDSHDSFFFLEAHSTLSASGDAACATCHEERFCVSCHDGPVNGGYHPPDFVARHTADAFGQDAECSNCHSSRAFCRECHLEIGLVPAGGARIGAGYHDDGPLWLLRHGQAARQNLEGCVSCHRQVDCTQCHSVLGAFKVSPHTLGFDAERAWARSPRTCLACHVGNPLN